MFTVELSTMWNSLSNARRQSLLCIKPGHDSCVSEIEIRS